MCKPATTIRQLLLLCVLLLATLTPARAAAPPATSPVQPRWLGQSRHNRSLIVAGATGEWLSLAAEGQVTQRSKLPQQVAAVLSIPNHPWLLSVDGRGSWQVVDEQSLQQVAAGRIPLWLDGFLPPSDESDEFIGSSSWGRGLIRCRLDAGASPAPPSLRPAGALLELPFCPGVMQPAPAGDLLVVAEKFGSRIAIVDMRQWRLTAIASLEGHNIGGLATSPDGQQLAVAHQWLSQQPTTADNLREGRLVRNRIIVLSWHALRENPQQALQQTQPLDLDVLSEHGAADPQAIAFVDRQRLLVVCHGSQQLLLVDLHGGRRVKQWTLGHGPQALLRTAADQWHVACRLSGEVLKIEIADNDVAAIPVDGPAVDEDWAWQGQRLFYDARLSAGHHLSCHSCHTEGHTNQQLADTLGDNSYGAPKLTPSLLGTSLTDPWGWLGNVKELGEQVERSVQTTLHGEIDARQRRWLITYLFQLETPPSVDEARGTPPLANPTRTDQGLVFSQRGCANCHIGPLTYTTNGNFDIGLGDRLGQTRFNPPSLRGVSQRDRFLHDGRAASLREVLEDWGHPPGADLSPDELAAVLEFLKQL